MIKRFFKNLILRITSCVMAIVTLFSAGGCSLADVFAWMSDNGLSSPIDITSNVHKTYFNGGVGSAVDPYQIHTPLQLYYFAWLQDLGLFNVDGNDEGTEIDTVYFVLTNNINMKDDETQYTLPPIGTTEYPFVGNFNGQGYTVSNLTVENERNHLFEPPDGSDAISQYTEIIGFFGVVGSIDDKYKNEDGTYNYATQANAVTNLVIEDITIITQTERALVGFVAGYVNGTVDCVGVADGTVKVSSGTKSLSTTTENATTVLEGATNISDYSLIGYCTPNYKNELYVFGSSIAGPGTAKTYTVVLDNSNDGEGQGWGGSIKMSDIYSWLNKNATANSSKNGYILERTDVVMIDSKTRVTTDKSNTASKQSFSIADFGAFVGTTMSNPNVNFVGGGQKVTEYKYTSSTTETDDVYYIKDGDYYLNFDGNGITSQGNPTQWYRGITVNDEVVAGAIYTVTDDKRVYFLTINNGNVGVIAELNVDPANLPEWKNTGNGYALNNQRIICTNGQWVVDDSFKIYYENNGTKNYLTKNNENNGIQSTQTENQAVTWTMTAVNDGYQISTNVNGTKYYLSYTQSGIWNTTVSGPNFNTRASTWQLSSDNQLYVEVSGRYTTTYYLQYNNGWTMANNTNYSKLTFGYTTNSNVQIVGANATKPLIKLESSEYIDTSLTNGYYDESGVRQPSGFAGITYFPLSFNSTNNTINANNTGYIVGAEWDTTTYEDSAQDGNASNLRISSYASNYSNNMPSESEARNPYTISYKTKGDDGKYKFEKVNVQRAESEEELNLTTDDSKRLTQLGLQKYAGCYDNYLDSVLDNSWEGLHFMNAPILETNITTITATLKNQKIDGYEVPTNSIDFHLYDKGLINVVAGSYYSQRNSTGSSSSSKNVNNSFFSIYQIERTGKNKEKILWIKEICKVYAKNGENGEIDESADYVYTYYGKNRQEVDAQNNTVGSNGLSGYTMVFDCDWITNSDGYDGWSTGRAYYFEVPVNKGEYAIGSTKDRTGAYLVYLDLAANAQLLERAKDCEEIIENKTQVSIPVGKVDMLALEEGKEYTLDELKTILGDLDSFKTAFASITTSAGGSAPDSLSAIKVTRTGNTIKVITDSGGVIAEYIYENSALTVDGDQMSIPITQTTTIVRTTYRDKNKTTGDLTVTVLTETTVVTKEPNGTTTTKTTYTKTVTVTDKDGNPVKDKDGNSIDTDDTITDMKDFAPDTLDPTTGVESADVGKKFIDLAFVYGAEVQLEISYSYQNGGFDSNDKPTGTYVITIKNPGKTDVMVKAILTQDAIESGITFIINGTALKTTKDAQTVTIEGENKANEPTDEPTE